MYIQKVMPFRNRKSLGTLQYVIFFQIEEATSLKFEFCDYLNKEDPIKIIVIVFVNCLLSTLIRTSVFFFITDYILKFKIKEIIDDFKIIKLSCTAFCMQIGRYLYAIRIKQQ